jgi:hypothetical protein
MIMKELVAVFTFLVIMLFVLGLPLMLLWNWLMPTIFGLPEITFWQSVGLNMLSGILFKLNYKKSKE